MRWLGRRGGGPGPGPGGGAQPPVSVAIPVRDGGPLLERTLAALATQTVAHELLVCDSGSRDGSTELARAHGARVIEIAPRDFGHGATRNLLMAQARGAHVALLTQDAEPASERWLEELLGGFALGEDVGIVYGPYLPRADAPRPVARELEGWFASLAPDGAPRVERLDERERTLGAGELVRQHDWELVGRRGFFTDANACLARAAWERAPFREVPYAEDRLLALDMMRAGYAKAYVPAAAVLHSHDYTPSQELRRAFDEWRGLLEVYGWRRPLDPRHLAMELRGAAEPSQCAASDRRRARLARRPAPAGPAAAAVARGPRRVRAHSISTTCASDHVNDHLKPLTLTLRRRIHLTYRYLGWRTLLFRVLTLPLRFTPLRRYLKPARRGIDNDYRRAVAWYREHGEPVDDRDPELPRRRARGEAGGEHPRDGARGDGADLRGRRRERPGARRGAAARSRASRCRGRGERGLRGQRQPRAARRARGWRGRRGGAQLRHGRAPGLAGVPAVREPRQEDDIGIVGARLLYPDGRIQFAGTVRNRGAPEWFDHRYRFKPERLGARRARGAGAGGDGGVHVRAARADRARGAARRALPDGLRGRRLVPARVAGGVSRALLPRGVASTTTSR